MTASTDKTSDAGLESVKSLRERLDKKLKAISETIDSISKKEISRGLSSNRERENMEFRSIDKKPYNKYNYSNNIFTSVDNFDGLPNFNTDNNSNIEFKKKDRIYENKYDNLYFANNKKESPNLNHEKDKDIYKDINAKINTDFIQTKYNPNTIDKTSLKRLSDFDSIQNEKEIQYSLTTEQINESKINAKISKNENLSENYLTKDDTRVMNKINDYLVSTEIQRNAVNSKENDFENKTKKEKSNIMRIQHQEELYNINSLNNTSAAIEINPTNFNKNFIIEENFSTNDINYKNFINNEISKISHDNYNDENDEISVDEEVENFDIKKKKHSNLIIKQDSDDQMHLKNNFINIKENDVVDNQSETSDKKFLNYKEVAFQKINEKYESSKLKNLEEIDSVSQTSHKKNKEKELILKENWLKKNEFFTDNAKPEKKYSDVNINMYNINTYDTDIELNRNKLRDNGNNNSQFLDKEKKSKQMESNVGNKNNRNIDFITKKNEISVLQNINNNSLENIDHSMIKIHDENLLLKIEETDKEKYLEQQRIQEELEKIESNLNLMQRLTHEKWQIRKNAFKQIAELIMTIQAHKNENETDNDIQETMETLFPWFKYLITDTNVITLKEGLNSFCYLLEFCDMEQKNKALILFYDELEKLIMHNKISIIEICIKIILNSIYSKKFVNFTISEIIRKLKTTNNKLLLFSHRVIEEILDNPGMITEHHLKLLFEKVVLYFNSTKQLNKNVERKKIYGKIIVSIFEKIKDDLQTIKHHLNLNSEDSIALEKILIKLNKEKEENQEKIFNFILYEPFKCKNLALNKNIDVINSNKSKKSEIASSNIIAMTNFDKNAIGPSNNCNLNSTEKIEIKNLNNNNNDILSNLITEQVDLFSVLPNEFFEIPYITSLKIKKETLEGVNKKLSNYVSIKDREYKEVLNIINYAIDDTNILVNLEGVRFLKNFCRLNNSPTNQSKLKNLVISCYEKFKDKKTNVKIELFDLFDTILINQIFTFEQFFIMKLQHVLGQKNPIVKLNILEYIKQIFIKCEKFDNSKQINKFGDLNSKQPNFLTKVSVGKGVKSDKRGEGKELNLNVNLEEPIQDEQQIENDLIQNNVENNQTLREILNTNLISKTLLKFSKLLVDITKDDSQSQVKDLCVDILNILKNILIINKDYKSFNKFENMIASLPIFRANMINTGANSNSEKEYKENLNKIKSSLHTGTRNRSHSKTGRFEKFQSTSKDKKLKNGLKNNLNKNNKYINTESSGVRQEFNDKNQNNEEDEENENSLEENKISKHKLLKRYNTNNDFKNKRQRKTFSGSEDSKYLEDKLSDDELCQNKKNKDLKKKTPNIKLISKNSAKDNSELIKNKKGFYSTKNRKLNRDEENFSSDKFKKLKQKDKEEILRKAIRDKSQDKKTILSNKVKQLNENIKKINPNNISKVSSKDDSDSQENTHPLSNPRLGKNDIRTKHNQENKKKKNNEFSDMFESEISGISEIPQTNRTDRTNLEKKMHSAIEYIYNLNEESIFDYTKSVIRDFLIFIKKVTSSNNTKEDLDCHFKVILKILENIFNQMEILAKKLEYEKLNIFIPDEIFIQTFKIITVAPCFLADIEKYLLPFMKNLRKMMENDKRFFEIYYEILNKFICFEKGSTFLQGVNSKNTFIVFYDFFLLNDPGFEDKDILQNFEPYILKNVLINEDEKMKYKKDFRQAIKILEITQNSKHFQKDSNTNNKNNCESNSFLEDNITKKFRTQKDTVLEGEGIYIQNLKSPKSKNNESYQENIEEDSDLIKKEEIQKKSNYNINEHNDKIIEKDRDKKINCDDENHTSNFNNKKAKEQTDEYDLDEEALIIQNYGIFFKEESKHGNNLHQTKDAEKNAIKKKTFEAKSQNLKNTNENSIINVTSQNNENFEIEKSQSIEKSNARFAPENLDKDILKIKDSIKEKCRKLDMNIKRINNKIENEANLNNKNSKSDRISEIQNTSNINTNNSYISNQKNNQTQNISNEFDNHKQQGENQQIYLSEHLEKNNLQQHFKPKRNLDELDEYEPQNSNKQISQDIYNIYNLPKYNQFIPNRLNPYPITNRSNNEISYSNISSNNPSFDFSQRQNTTSNLINHNNYIQKSGFPNDSFLNIEEIKKLILKIPTIILDDCVSEISHYVLLENYFTKMNTELKIEFSSFLSGSLNNSSLIKTSSFNCFLQLLEFLLTLLIFEMKNSHKNNYDPNSKAIILKIQETIENILKHKNYTDIFKLLIFLLRKYLPNDFNVQIEKDNLLYLKTISYLLKISIENKIKQQANISTTEILSETNELFIMYSPTNLNPNIPNLEDLDKIYKLLRLLTDEALIGSQNIAMAKTFLENSKKFDSQKYCSLYLQYIQNMIESNYNKN